MRTVGIEKIIGMKRSLLFFAYAVTKDMGGIVTKHEDRKSDFAQTLRSNSLLLLVAALYFLVNVWLHFIAGRPIGFSFLPYFQLFLIAVLPLSLIIAVPLHMFLVLLKDRPQRPFSHLIECYSAILGNPQRWINIALASVLMMLAFSSYTGIKALIPLMVEHNLDALFAHWDNLLHGGKMPWEWLQPILGSTVFTAIIDRAYTAWFVVMFLFWSAAALTLNPDKWSRQFMLAFILIWIIGGNILAAALYSMGPVYYDIVDPINNPFKAQMAALYEMHANYPIQSLNNQALLRSTYLNPIRGGLGGISAMPSLHNGTSALFMLAAFRIRKSLGYVMLCFLILIVLGSVHLGWHYAIDAYAGIALAFAIWWFSGLALQSSDGFWKRRLGA